MIMLMMILTMIMLMIMMKIRWWSSAVRFPWVSALLMRLLTQPPLLACCPPHWWSKVDNDGNDYDDDEHKVTMMVLTQMPMSNLLIKTQAKTKKMKKLDKDHKCGSQRLCNVHCALSKITFHQLIFPCLWQFLTTPTTEKWLNAFLVPRRFHLLDPENWGRQTDLCPSWDRLDNSQSSITLSGHELILE